MKHTYLIPLLCSITEVDGRHKANERGGSTTDLYTEICLLAVMKFTYLILLSIHTPVVIESQDLPGDSALVKHLRVSLVSGMLALLK